MADEIIGLVAGSGQFPFLMARQARQAGLKVAAIGLSGFTDPGLESEVDLWEEVSIGQLNKLIKFFKSNKVTKLALVGSINKSKAINLKPDFRAIKLILSVRKKGDDAILRAIIGELESEGLSVVQGADLVPGLAAPVGVLGQHRPDEEQRADLDFAYKVAKDLGRHDIGQCVVVKRGIIAAVEAMEGTDAAVRRGCGLAGKGCVVVKVVKPGQDRRIDLPALGLDTIKLMQEMAATCLGFEAGSTLFFDLAESIRLADQAGICLVGLPEQEAAGEG